jgi:integrase
MTSKRLTQAAIDSLLRGPKPYKVADGGGLHLLVNPNGSKLWRLAYRFGGKQKTLALGVYDRSTNGLIEARAKQASAKLALKAGLDPAGGVTAADGQTTFEAVALAWHAHNSHRWSEKYASIVLARLEAYVFPMIGRKAIGAVKRSDVLAVLREIEGRGILDTAHRVKQYIGGVFRFSDDDTVTDPTPMLKGRLKTPPRVQHHKSLKAPEIGPFLLKLDADTSEQQTRLAILLTILTAARTMEVIGARWDEFEDLKFPKRALWRVPAERMKESREHLVPLSPQALAVLTDLHKLTGNGEHLFPGRSGTGTMSNNTMIFRLYALGYRDKSTMHGFRGSFSTIANESGLWAPDVIELCLAHAQRNAVRAAYNSAEHLPKRRELITWWGNQLETMRTRARMDARRLG